MEACACKLCNVSLISLLKASSVQAHALKTKQTKTLWYMFINRWSARNHQFHAYYYISRLG
jgi:hypothetical protein